MLNFLTKMWIVMTDTLDFAWRWKKGTPEKISINPDFSPES